MPISPERLQKGESIRVRRDASDEWCPAFVVLASQSNPSSVMLLLDGVVRGGSGIVSGALPLTVDYDAETVVSLFGDSYEIEVQDADLP